MRRAALAIALLPAAALLLATGPAEAGNACPVVDGRLVAQAAPGTTYLRVQVGDTTVRVLADNLLQCEAERASAPLGAVLSDTDGAVIAWQVEGLESLPGEVYVDNDAEDEVRANLGTGVDRITAGRENVVRVRDGSGVTTLEASHAPTRLGLLVQGPEGLRLVDLTTGAGWDGDVRLDVRDGGINRGTARAATGVTVRLGAGDDGVYLVDRADSVSTGGGVDQVDTGGGPDRVTTGPGGDYVSPGPGRDVALLGRGRDLVYAQDGRRDRLDGGGGRDGAEWDRGVDVRRSIEFRIRNAPA